MSRQQKALTRTVFILALLFLVVSYYLQYIKELQPCSLCLMQRFSMAVIFVLSLFELLLSHFNHLKRLSFIAWLASMFGIYFAGRQIWLMFLPAEKKAMCSPALHFMIENDFPFSEVMKSLFLGSGDCASVEWVLFNMPLAYWSFAGFLVLFALLSTRLFLDKTTTAG